MSGYRGFKDKQPFALATVAEVKGFVAAFHIKPEAPGCAALVGVLNYLRLFAVSFNN